MSCFCLQGSLMIWNIIFRILSFIRFLICTLSYIFTNHFTTRISFPFQGGRNKNIDLFLKSDVFVRCIFLFLLRKRWKFSSWMRHFLLWCIVLLRSYIFIWWKTADFQSISNTDYWRTSFCKNMFYWEYVGVTYEDYFEDDSDFRRLSMNNDGNNEVISQNGSSTWNFRFLRKCIRWGKDLWS